MLLRVEYQNITKPDSCRRVLRKDTDCDSVRTPLQKIDSNTMSSKEKNVEPKMDDGSPKKLKPTHSSFFRRHRLLWITGGTVVMASFIGWCVSRQLDARSCKLLIHQCRDAALQPGDALKKISYDIHDVLVRKATAVRSTISYQGIQSWSLSLLHHAQRVFGHYSRMSVERLDGMGRNAFSTVPQKYIELKEITLNGLKCAFCGLSQISREGFRALGSRAGAVGNKLLEHGREFCRKVLYPAFEKVAQSKIMEHDRRAGSGLVTFDELKKLSRDAKESARQFASTVLYPAAKDFLDARGEQHQLLIKDGMEVFAALTSYCRICRDSLISLTLILTAYIHELAHRFLEQMQAFYSLIVEKINTYILLLEKKVQISIDAAVLNLRREYKQIVAFVHSTTIGNLILGPMN